MEPKFVFVVGGSRNYYRPFASLGEYVDNNSVFEDPRKKHIKDNIALMLFTGGEDVGPKLYNEPIGSKTYFSEIRDNYEVKFFEIARNLNIPMVGVCRGAQLLSVLSGGKLVQHLNGHSGNHEITLWDGRKIIVSSCHHQMQLPPASAQVIGWSSKRLSTVYLDGRDKKIEIEKEIEIVHYPTINAVGMQHHPEFMDKSSDGFKIASELVTTFLGVGQEEIEKAV